MFFLVALLVPLTADAAGRDLTTQQILGRAEEQAQELLSRPCVTVALDREAPSANLKIVAGAMQLAGVFDFFARNVPDKDVDRARNISYAVRQAVDSYERAYTCAPSHESRYILMAALDLIEFAMKDLERQPPTVASKHHPTYQAQQERIERLMPAGKRRCPTPPATQCSGPPELEKRSRCSVASDRPSDAALLLVLLCMLTRRRRRS